MAKVAGSSVLSFRVFLEKTYGQGVFERALELLPPEEAEVFGGIILPVNWYSTATYMRALHAAEERTNDPYFFDKFGAFAADFQISAFRKFILRFTSPGFFLEHGTRLWGRTHDTGRWQVEQGNKQMKGTLRDFAVVDPDYCRVLVAWIHRASQLTGTRGHTVHRTCRARGAETCVFEGWWE